MRRLCHQQQAYCISLLFDGVLRDRGTSIKLVHSPALWRQHVRLLFLWLAKLFPVSMRLAFSTAFSSVSSNLNIWHIFFQCITYWFVLLCLNVYVSIQTGSVQETNLCVGHSGDSNSDGKSLLRFFMLGAICSNNNQTSQICITSHVAD